MRILREPLLHFLLLGGLVYAASVQLEADSGRYRIDAGPARRARLEATYRQQYGVAPTQAQLAQLLDQYIRGEILYREGLAMGLEQDDEIVRRRVVQKVEFVNEDLDTEAQPDEPGLAAYFRAHQDRYNTAPEVSFRQIFVSADTGGDGVARLRAQRILRSLRRGNAGAAPNDSLPGDPFAAGSQFTALSRAAANSLFGDSQLSEALFAQPVGEWTGPYRSAYGWHLVRICDRQEARAAALQAVRARVIADYLSDLRTQRNLLAFRRIAGKYHIVTSEPRA
jgi:parvulin-like peptidyl-prolyl isomerase